MGSPPLTRGIQSPFWASACAARITPAYAGNTQNVNYTSKRTGDHPRLRGEYHKAASRKRGEQGSPPLTRGILRDEPRKNHDCGITPAYAGNTNNPEWGDRNRRDHPRLRGEYFDGYMGQDVILGSPPLTRGIPHMLLCTVSLCGITPAYAGNTSLPVPASPAFRDHPRLRGEYVYFIACIKLGLGSPPLTRGILSGNRFGTWCSGITPAYAGNTILA